MCAGRQWLAGAWLPSRLAVVRVEGSCRCRAHRGRTKRASALDQTSQLVCASSRPLRLDWRRETIVSITDQGVYPNKVALVIKLQKRLMFVNC